MEHPALSHIEKTLAEIYRKEIDQEENVWRTLPFFAAALGLQITALFQLGTRFPPFATWVGWVAIVLLILSGLLIFVALCFLIASVAPARFRYIARGTDLVRYTEELIQAEQAAQNQGQGDTLDALATLKGELSRQYAVAADHNRQINKRREAQRAFAGLAVMASVVTTLLLVSVAFLHYVPNLPGDEHGSAHTDTSPDTSGHPPTGAGSSGLPGGATRPQSSPNADHH